MSSQDLLKAYMEVSQSPEFQAQQGQPPTDLSESDILTGTILKLHIPNPILNPYLNRRSSTTSVTDGGNTIFLSTFM